MNEKLQAMDVKFMDGKKGPKNFDAVGSGDVVILPAFGATIQEMQLLDEKYHLYSIHTCTYTYIIVYFPRTIQHMLSLMLSLLSIGAGKCK